ncbi:sugar transporter [Apiospora arundinis]
MDANRPHECNKAALHAWRKKPRKFAPKSRLGCKICKIRRVKCDETRPSCLKCTSTGRKCDGYGGSPSALQAAEQEPDHDYNEKVRRPGSSGTNRPLTTVRVVQPQAEKAGCHGLTMQNLGPLMVLPVTGPAQTEVLSFFEYISVRQLNEYQPCESWRRTLMFFSQTVPAVRHAALAVSMAYRSYLDRDSQGILLPQSPQQTQPWRGWLPDKTPLLHYNRAIQLLLDQKTEDSTETTAITLLVCYLFTCFEHLAGCDVQAMKHLRGGVELLRRTNPAILENNTDAYDDANPSGVHTLIRHIARQIRRLDMQAVTFLLDWTPADIQEFFMFQLPSCKTGFRSLDEAADHLQILIARVMILRNMEHQNFPDAVRMPPPIQSLKDAVLGQLDTWSRLFENMLLQRESGGGLDAADSEFHGLVSMLRLQHTAVWTFLRSYGDGGEMDFDEFLPEFRYCVDLADRLASAHERYSGSLTPTFTPEVGIVPVLYLIGVKCRHPVVRRQVLSILRRQPTREAVWDSMEAAKVVERVIEIEEGGLENGERSQGMGQIAVWQRVETMAWLHVFRGSL